MEIIILPLWRRYFTDKTNVSEKTLLQTTNLKNRIKHTSYKQINQKKKAAIKEKNSFKNIDEFEQNTEDEKFSHNGLIYTRIWINEQLHEATKTNDSWDTKAIRHEWSQQRIIRKSRVRSER